MKKKLQLFIQIAFLITFVYLFFINKVQMWMVIFLSGVFLSFFLGRVYCGWICPINTVMQWVTWAKNRWGIKSLPIPSFFTKSWLPLFVLGLFIGVFVFTITFNKSLPILPILFILGIVLTFFFPEKLWHGHLCPYGILLSFSTKKAIYGMKIDKDKCNNCGVCKRLCPTNSIEKTQEHHKINQSLCLVCIKCSDNCRQDAIKVFDQLRC